MVRWLPLAYASGITVWRTVPHCLDTDDSIFEQIAKESMIAGIASGL